MNINLQAEEIHSTRMREEYNFKTGKTHADTCMKVDRH